MRPREYHSALLITVLMLSALTTAMIPVSATTPVSGNISTNVEWSGDILLTGYVYVEHGVTLNLKAGTVVNADQSFRADVSHRLQLHFVMLFVWLVIQLFLLLNLNIYQRHQTN